MLPVLPLSCHQALPPLLLLLQELPKRAQHGAAAGYEVAGAVPHLFPLRWKGWEGMG